jgi:pyruvate dehydrogenase E1 component
MLVALPGGRDRESAAESDKLALLEALERKALWLSTWMIHNANHVRRSRDGLKVGGHQASSASAATLLSALYLDVMQPQDRIAVKPHAAPLFHALQYLLGHQTQDKLERFRALGGAQAYPSRSKDGDIVDFSTGSVGLGVGFTLFASLVQDYLRLQRLIPTDVPPGRMIALAGDAELDEGNIYEALLEGWKHDVRNLWWVIDYNRQSLDAVVSDRLFGRIDALFEMFGWRVVTLKYGRLLETAFARPDGTHLREWIDACPNSLYSALVYKGGEGWREHLRRDLNRYPGIRAILDEHDDAALARLMTNLAGHDMGSVLDAFHAVTDDRPTCFIAYTIKGFGLPFAGHKDNHAGLMNPGQIAALREKMGIEEGAEWEPWAGLGGNAAEAARSLAENSRIARAKRERPWNQVAVPAIPAPSGEEQSTQAAFGRILLDLSRAGGMGAAPSPGRREGAPILADRIVTTSPDVTVSTNLGAWVNQRGLFRRQDLADVFAQAKIPSAQKWGGGKAGQHIELGIAENNLFLMLAALGLAGDLFGTRLFPIGTVYDPFIARGLDALNYACYQDTRFMLVATPSGVTLGPEGGAHQSINPPLIALGQPGLRHYEPAYVDELALLMEKGFRLMQAPDGESVYLRLTTRTIKQVERPDESWKAGAVAGGYWFREPAPGAEAALVFSGALAPEALAAWEALKDDVPGLGLLAITSPDLLHRGWSARRRGRWTDGDSEQSHVERLLTPLAPHAGLVTLLDAAPASLSWLGGVRGQKVSPLGVERFGQTGNLDDLYREYRLDSSAIVEAIAELFLD